MKLQLGTKYVYDGDNYIFEKLGKRKKITSRIFPSLIFKNKYESVGHALLERFGLLEKEEIHPFYSVRGEIAERMVLKYLKEQNAELILKTWEAEEVNFDNFPNNPDFGGLIDIAIAAPEEYRAVVEIKSKEIKKYKTIKDNGGSPEELLQGEFLGYLSNVRIFIMAFVFFTKEQELQINEFIRDDFLKGYEINAKVMATKILNHYQWQPHDLKYVFQEKRVRREQTANSAATAKELMDAFEQSRELHQIWLAPDERIYLNTYHEHHTGTKIPQAVDRPF